MKIVKPILTFIGGVAVGILAVTGVYALEDDLCTESIDNDTDCDEEIEPEKTFEDNDSDKISEDVNELGEGSEKNKLF